MMLDRRSATPPRGRTATILRRGIFSLVLALWLAGAGGTQDGVQVAPFLVGEFKVKKVIDGDTILVDGLKNSIRFLCIDTEECEKGPGARERTLRIASDYAAYARTHLHEKPLSGYSTPMGWEAKEFAGRWFPIGSPVRVEYDDPARKHGYYGRVLGYVFAQRDGKWVNYNVECVRAGMSAYFEKYGRSDRFEAAFIAAEREARMHRRGIWSRYAMGYPNYDERLTFWHRRGRTISHFQQKYAADPNAALILNDDGWRRLVDRVGKEVLIFSTVNGWNDKVEPPVLELHHKEFARIAVTFANPEVLEAAREFLTRYEKDFVYLRARLGKAARLGARDYAYTVSVDDPKQFSVEIPGADSGRPRRAVKVSGDRIRWQDAARHVGRTVSLVGRIVRTKNIGKLTFLNFDPDFRRTVTLVVREENYAKFPQPAEKIYADRVILVRGKVTEHKGTAQIEVVGPEQIEIIE